MDHSFHAITRSFDFLREVLAKEAEVINFWDDTWTGGDNYSATEINASDPDAIVFCQYIPSRKELKKLKCRNITYVPMWDSPAIEPKRYKYYREHGIKLALFCRRQYEIVRAEGICAEHFQYFPPVSDLPEARPVNDPIRVFFWQRLNFPNMDVVRHLLGETPFEIVLKFKPDPQIRVVRPFVGDLKVTHQEGWLEKHEYLELLRGCDLFVAPRVDEGIGQATLDAMRNGLAVAAADAETANEYITHNVNGYLYDPDNIEALDLSNIAEMRQAALDSIVRGHQAWQEQADTLRDFVLDPMLCKPSAVARAEQLIVRKFS